MICDHSDKVDAEVNLKDIDGADQHNPEQENRKSEFDNPKNNMDYDQQDNKNTDTDKHHMHLSPHETESLCAVKLTYSNPAANPYTLFSCESDKQYGGFTPTGYNHAFFT